MRYRDWVFRVIESRKLLYFGYGFLIATVIWTGTTFYIVRLLLQACQAGNV